MLHSFYLVQIKHRINKKTILDRIQLSNFTSGSWLQIRSETYAYAYGNLRYYGVVYGPYGSRGPGHLRPLRTLLIYTWAPNSETLPAPAACTDVLVTLLLQLTCI
jgi:hypothetical protein